METALKSHIAENLRKHRVLRGFTQEYIAEYLGKKTTQLIPGMNKEDPT